MWLLECDGDLFDGKKLWLRPGKSVMIGRTGHSSEQEKSPGERKYEIQAKTVSRQHLVIAVQPVKPGDGSKPHAKSELRLTDNSKFGTVLDGAKFQNGVQILNKAMHTFSLGKDQISFKITWHQVALSMSFTDKQMRAGSDLLQPYRKVLEQLDIKVIHPFVTDTTTHVVAAKRNIPKVLLALVHARLIVTESYIDAIVKAAASPGAAADGTPLSSPLEDDFNGTWPDAAKFLPGPAKEPNPRPPEFFAPDTARSTVLEGFTFVFADKSQHENLAEPVSGGGAKCPFYNLELGKTRVKQLADYVRSLAGNKGFDPGSAKGAVVVRFRSREPETASWAIQFIQDLDLELGQRSVEQNEFLDAILTKDASQLKRALEEGVEEVASTEPPPRTERRRVSTEAPAPNRNHDSAGHGPSAAVEADAAIEATQTGSATSSRRSRWRDRRAKSQFLGFDDSDEAKIDALDSVPEETNTTAMDVDGGDEGLFVGEDNANAPHTSGRKRGVASEPNDLDQLFPASHTMKRRKLAQDSRAGNVRESIAPDEQMVDDQEQVEIPSSSKKGSKKGRDNVDLREAAKSHAKVMDKQRHGRTSANDDEQDDSRAYEEDDIEQLAKLVIVEDMDVPAHRSKKHNQGVRGARSTDDEGRWKDEWNGRKNFKGFRRKGEATPNRAQRVIVRVEEEKYGADEHSGDYWLEGSQTGEQDRRQHDKDGSDSDEDEDGQDRQDRRIGTKTSGRSQKRAASSQIQGRGAKTAKRARHSAQSHVAEGAGRNEGSIGGESSSSEDDGGLRFRLRRRKRD